MSNGVARELARAIAERDYLGYFDWRFGGEGDNGEVLVDQIHEALPQIREIVIQHYQLDDPILVED